MNVIPRLMRYFDIGEFFTMGSSLSEVKVKHQRYQGVLQRFVKYPRDLLIVVLTAAVVFRASFFWPQSTDIALYVRYAQHFLVGHHFPPEYPPLTLAVFLIPNLSPSNAYLIFGCVMLSVVVIAYLIATHYTSRFRAMLVALYILVGNIPMVVGRYDVLPALLTLFALYMTRSRHWRSAYLLLTLGVFIKLYPLLLIPVVLIAQWQSLPDFPAAIRVKTILQRSVPALCASIVIVGCALILSPTTALGFLTFAARRPTQIEAVSGTSLWLWGTLHGNPPAIVAAYGSHNFAGGASSFFAAASPYLMILGILIIYIWYYRGHVTTDQAFLLIVGVVIMTSKVFSTQYLLWLLPFIGEVSGISVLWIAICIATSLDGFFYPFVSNQPESPVDLQRFLALVALRNMLFVVAMVRSFFSWDLREDQGVATPIAPKPH